MKSIAEELIRGIGAACKAEPSVRLSASGGTAFYPVSDRLKAAFLDGGELRELAVKVKLKGEVPSLLFSAAERFCDSVCGIDEIKGENFRVVRLEPTERAAMESCAENGMSIVSFMLTAEYLLERGERQNEDSIHGGVGGTA